MPSGASDQVKGGETFSPSQVYRCEICSPCLNAELTKDSGIRGPSDFPGVQRIEIAPLPDERGRRASIICDPRDPTKAHNVSPRLGPFDRTAMRWFIIVSIFAPPVLAMSQIKSSGYWNKAARIRELRSTRPATRRYAGDRKSGRKPVMASAMGGTSVRISRGGVAAHSAQEASPIHGGRRMRGSKENKGGARPGL